MNKMFEMRIVKSVSEKKLFDCKEWRRDMLGGRFCLRMGLVNYDFNWVS